MKLEVYPSTPPGKTVLRQGGNYIIIPNENLPEFIESLSKGQLFVMMDTKANEPEKPKAT